MADSCPPPSNQEPPPLPPKRKSSNRMPFDALCAVANEMRQKHEERRMSSTGKKLVHQDTMTERKNYFLSPGSNRSHMARSSADDVIAMRKKSQEQSPKCNLNPSDGIHFHTLKCHPKLQGLDWTQHAGPGEFMTQPRRKASYAKLPPEPPPRVDSMIRDLKCLVMRKTATTSSNADNDNGRIEDAEPPELPIKLRTADITSCGSRYQTTGEEVQQSSSGIVIPDSLSSSHESNPHHSLREGTSSHSPHTSQPSQVPQVPPVISISGENDDNIQLPRWNEKLYSFSCPHQLCSHASTYSDSSQSTQLSRDSGVYDPGKPPPLPPKKRHVMQYVQMMGSYRGPNEPVFNMYRRSVHAHHGQTASSRHPRLNTLRQVEVSFFQQRSLDSSLEFTPVSASSESTFSFSSKSSTASGDSCRSSGGSIQDNSVSSTTTLQEYTPQQVSPPALPPLPLHPPLSPSDPSLNPTVTKTAKISPTSPPPSLPPKTFRNKKKLDQPDVVLSASHIDKPTDSCCSSSTPPTAPSEPTLLDETDVSRYIILRTGADSDGPEIRGGPPDALLVKATEVTKNDFLFQEAFLQTYRTFLSPDQLVEKLLYRYNKFACPTTSDGKQKTSKIALNAFALLVRIVDDLCVSECTPELMDTVLNFVQQLVSSGDLALAKLLRTKTEEKIEAKKAALEVQPVLLPSVAISTKVSSVLDFKAHLLAEQMTLVDSELFSTVEVAEALLWAKEQKEEVIPNLTKFTEHFNNVSYWIRTRILQEEEAKERDKLAMKFIKIMKSLRRLSNFNSIFAILSALDSAPLRRLDWPRSITEGMKEFSALIDSSSSFRTYRQALAETDPPCIPYIGLILQDLTFVHVGNDDFLPDGNVNFGKRWLQFNILDQMRRYRNSHYPFTKNEEITSLFSNFEDYLDEDSLWQISETLKPRKK